MLKSEKLVMAESWTVRHTVSFILPVVAFAPDARVNVTDIECGH